MDKTKVWVKCLTTTHNGEACSEDCLIQEYIERQLKNSYLEKYLRTDRYSSGNDTVRVITNLRTGEQFNI